MYAPGAELLLEALQGLHRGEHRPGLPWILVAAGRHQPHESAAAGDGGLEVEEGLHKSGVLVDLDRGRFLAFGKPEPARAAGLERPGQGRGDGAGPTEGP